MDAEIDAENDTVEVVEVDLLFRKPPETTDYELEKTFWIIPKEEANSTNENNSASNPDQEPKPLQPLALQTLETTEDEGSSCSHSESERLPEEILNESMDDEVFEEEPGIENIETDLLFRQPKNTEMELVYTISKGATINLNELEEEDEDVDVDLWFREPTDTRFELVYTIPLMEDVSVDSLGGTLEDVPPAEELDNVVEEAAEFTFKPIENDEEKTETETLTTEMVTVLEKNQEDHVGEGSRDFIEKVKLTSNDTFDDFDGEEEAFQNAFVKSVETPETPTPEDAKNFEDEQDPSVSEVLKDAAEKLQFIQDSEKMDYSNDRDTVESEDAFKETASAPDILDVGSPEDTFFKITVSEDDNDAETEVIEKRDEENIDAEAVSSENVTQTPDLDLMVAELSDELRSDAVKSSDNIYDDNGNPILPEEASTTQLDVHAIDRFNVEPVDDILAVDAVNEADKTSKTKIVESESTPSDFDQLESVSASGDIPDVYRTLDSLRNEDVFPKEDTPSAPENDVPPEADSHESTDDQELKLEDSGIIETPDIVDLDVKVITDALNSEDVIKSSNDEGNPDTHAEVKLEDAGIVAAPIVHDVDQNTVQKALNCEDVTSFEPPGKIETLSTDVLDSTPDEQPELKLEDSGIIETPDIVNLESDVIEEAMNAEDIITTMDIQEINESNDAEHVEAVPKLIFPESYLAEDKSVSRVEEPVAESLVTEIANSTQNDEPELKLEDSGDVVTAEIVDLNKEVIEEALNSEDVVLSYSINTDETEPNDDTAIESQDACSTLENQPEEVKEEESFHTVKLEDSGIVETSDVVDQTPAEKTFDNESDVPEASKMDSEEIEERVSQSELKLEDAGIASTLDIVDLNEVEVEDALNSEDVVHSNETVVSELPTENVPEVKNSGTSNMNEMDQSEQSALSHFQNVPELNLEDSGISAIPDIIDLESEVITDALNCEDLVNSSGDILSTEPQNENDSKPETNTSREDSPERKSNDNEEPAIEVKLEDSGFAATPNIVHLDEEDTQDALNSEDVITSDDAVPEKLENESAENSSEINTDTDAKEVPSELKLEDAGIVESPDIVGLENDIVEEAMNAEDVIAPIDVQEEDGTKDAKDDEAVPKLMFPENFLDEDEIVSEVEESVADSQTEEDTIEESQEKERTPVQSTEEESFVDKFVPMEEGVLSGDDAFENPKEEFHSEQQKEETPSQESDVPANEESFVEKLVSMVENALPTDAVIPSEDVLNEDRPEKFEEEIVQTSNDVTTSDSNKESDTVEDTFASNPDDVETSQESTETGETIMQKLVSMVENVLPGSTAEEKTEVISPEESKEEDSIKNSKDTEEIGEPTVQGESMMQKLVSMVENALPIDSLRSSDKVEETTESCEGPAKQTNPNEEGTLQNSDEVEPVVEGESMMQKLVSMVESVLPVDAIILSDYVEQIGKNMEEKVTVVDSDDAVEGHQIQKNVEQLEAPPIQESNEEVPVAEVPSSIVEDNLPVDTAASSEHESETQQEDQKEDISSKDEADELQEPSFVEKCVSIVEDALLPTGDVIPSEDVLNEEHTGERLDDNEISQEAEKPGTISVNEEDAVAHTEDVLQDSQMTESIQNKEDAETVLEKLISTVESILPAGIVTSEQFISEETSVEQQPGETESHQEIESESGTTVAEVTASVDTLLQTEEAITEDIETAFDAEGFVSETVEESVEKIEVNPDNAADERTIASSDMPVTVETDVADGHEVIETPFDAEGFLSESTENNLEKKEVSEKDEQKPETQNVKTTTVEELVAMAVEILPIDGTVAENIEEPTEPIVEDKFDDSLAAKSTDPPGQLEEIATQEEQIDVSQEETHSDEIETGEKEYVPPEPEKNILEEPEVFKRVKRSGSPPNAEIENDTEIVEPDTTNTPTPIVVHDSEEEPAPKEENEMQIATVEVEVEQELNKDGEKTEHSEIKSPQIEVEEPLTKTTISTQESAAPHTITNLHFNVPKVHEDYGNDYVPFGTEGSKVNFNNPEDMREEEEDVVAELNFHPIRQWRDEDVISLQSLKSLVAEVGCTTEVEEVPKSPKPQFEDSESTLKILKVVPSEPSLMELDISNDPSVIHVPIPLMEPATKYLEDMVDWIISDAIKEVTEMEVVTESELSEMVAEESEKECPTPEPLTDLKLPFEDEEKTPEPDQIFEEPQIEVARVMDTEAVQTIPQRPPRAPKAESSKSVDHQKSKVRFGPLNIKLGRSYSEEQQKELVEMLERPLTVITASEPKPIELKVNENEEALSPLSPNTLDEYEHVPMMDMQSVPHSPQEKQDEPDLEKKLEQQVEAVDIVKTVSREEPKIYITETRILGPGKSMEYVGNEDEEGSECLDSIGDLSERTIQRFNTSIDDPSIRRDSFSSISSFGDRQKFRTAIENIRQDLLPFQSSVSQYLDPSVTPSQQLLVTNLSMDSPSDLSPNAPPVGFENTAQYLEKMQQQEDRPSAEGSIDSSGFEKVDHESLEDYGAPVHDPMQKSVFGSLTADADDMKPGSQDDGFVFIERNEASEGAKKKMSSHHDDVIEKNYYGEDAATAKLLESPIAEEARKLVQDAVESASEYSKHAVDDADEIGRELLDNVEHKIEQIKEPVADSLHKAYDGLGDFIHETVPEAAHDFTKEVEKALPESPIPEKIETPEPLVDIHGSVDKVHDEVDHFLRGRDPTPPLVEADEDAPTDDKPQFGNQTPEEDETTFDRKGPLTIPEEVEKAAAAQKYDEDLDEFDPLVSSNTGAAFGAAVGAAASEALTEEEMFGHQKFETIPRPPTPPKDISDEDVKPSTVNLGPAHHHSHPSSPHHSILKHHGEAWIDFKTVPPCVLDVIYWRDAKKSAVVLSLALLALFILAKYPLLTVITYTLLLALGAAAGFRVYKKVEAQIKKTDTENPFSEILSQDLALPQEKVHAQADVFVEHATCIANTLKKLVFVESPLESIKFGLVLWSLTYVASWFSGFCLATLGLLGVFSIPKVYEANQDAIDPHLATISGHLKNVQNLIDEKLPFLRSAPVAAEEKKDQ